jgi:hypothetical protein
LVHGWLRLHGRNIVVRRRLWAVVWRRVWALVGRYAALGHQRGVRVHLALGAVVLVAAVVDACCPCSLADQPNERSPRPACDEPRGASSCSPRNARRYDRLGGPIMAASGKCLAFYPDGSPCLEPALPWRPHCAPHALLHPSDPRLVRRALRRAIARPELYLAASLAEFPMPTWRRPSAPIRTAFGCYASPAGPGWSTGRTTSTSSPPWRAEMLTCSGPSYRSGASRWSRHPRIG